MDSLRECSLRICLQRVEESSLVNIHLGMSSDELKVIGKALKKAKREKKAIVALRTNCPPDQTFSAHTLSFLREIGYNFDVANVRQRIDPAVVLASALLSPERGYSLAVLVRGRFLR